MKYFTILRVNLWSLGICLLLLAVFATIIPYSSSRDVVAVGLYLWVALFGVLAASQFWMMASLVFDVRQAKRLFGPIGAGAIAGGIAGGYLATIIAGNFGIRALLFVAIAALVPVMLISIYIWRKYISKQMSQLSRKKKTSQLRESPHRLILGSKHLMLLCGIIATSVITAKLVDYQFSALAAERYADEDQLTAFFGFWFSTFNVIGLGIQLLLTQRIVQRLGVSGALMFLPTGLAAGAIAMFFVPGLGAAIFSRLTDGSLKQSLHRAGVEMLFLPVSTAVKGRIKTYIDVLIDSVAGGLGGLLLLMLVDGLGVSIVGISVPVLVFVTAWFVCVLLVRDEYLEAFRDQLRHLRPQKEPRRLKSRHKEVLAGFMRVLEDAKMNLDDKQLLYVLERTDDLSDEKFHEPIVKLLGHAKPAVRAKALRSLALRDGPNLLDHIIPLMIDDEVVVRNAALEYCISHHLEETRELIKEQLKDPDPNVSGTALVQLLVETRSNPDMRKEWELEKHFNFRRGELRWLTGPDAVTWRLKLLKAAGRSGSELGKDFIAEEMESLNLAVAKEAILAAGESLDERYLLRLIDFLSEAPYRPYAKSALVQYELGLVNLLPAYFKKHLIDLADIRRLPAVLERIPSQQTVDLLFAMVERYNPEDLEVRLEVLKALNAMRRDFPLLQMPTKKVFRQILTETKTYQTTINNLQAQLAQRNQGSEELQGARNGLLNLLHQRQEGNLDRLFRLLGLRYQPADIIPIFRGLHAANHQEKISALEFLDILLENNLKRLIIPVVEQGIRLAEIDERSTLMDAEELRIAQFRNFQRILRGRDVRLKLSVIYLIGHMGDETFMPLLRLNLESPDQRVRDMAGKAFDKILGEVLK
ncbi:Npt1/Npt2 family nucleotide transporter [Neolewinella aurantiaca]|uniref:Npt1/Npt2 family nucleotide transporter n=1 Tax=Neolewinella aurantiaca TaxID=2602767 RepID=UPI00164FB05B|nr:Npt1/Npt2 family nucleotide transporter [Neolewinella aurantiaca]